MGPRMEAWGVFLGIDLIMAENIANNKIKTMSSSPPNAPISVKPKGDGGSGIGWGF